MITVIYAVFGRGRIVEFVLTGIIDFLIQSFLLFYILNDAGLLK